ncbi:MAG: Uncharacterized protein G01um10143_376 [Parcubacteria group bacterium Gr01-1014_3]|nr:MAG: Uncharacterized protein G01um10143_376 [Parcubacteria group bacterium Gr01-1014_3]
MDSKWSRKKHKAIYLRRRGLSIGRIEKELKIHRSTLSGWFKNVELTKEQKSNLIKRWKNGLVKAREVASQWHRNEKQKRLLVAQKEAEAVLNNLNMRNKATLEIALAMLYMGEGIKSKDSTGMGNSNPLLLKSFVYMLKNFYLIPDDKLRCDLYLRADQSPEKMKKFWSKELDLPIENFKFVNLDKRTIGSKTYPSYKGVCAVSCGNVAIKRKLLNISKGFCERLIKMRP